MSVKKTEFKRWDQYVSEAQHDPFELPVSDDEVIVVAYPTGASSVQAARAFRNDDPQAFMSAVCGDQYDRVWDLVSSAPKDVMSELMTDMLAYFDMLPEYELVGPGGGAPVTENDPRRIKALRNKGWRFVGEDEGQRG